MKNWLPFGIILLMTNFSFSQSIKVEGKVLDSLQKPLYYANLIAEPTDSSKIEFTVTDELGRYQLKLKKGKTYEVKVSYIGYKSKNIKVKALKDTIINFELNESIEVLDEVKIDAKLAVSIKQDTITYLVDKFITGEERKLRDVLKKLPGVEVDRTGNVRVQGRRITKVLVENKQFFTGDSKLAVNNIPADVVNEIEILDDYTDVALLKGLEDTNDMAMNIKLKEDKKKFWFGDVETGGGIEDRYLVHPSIFYYSPNTSANFIFDFNNIGIKSFTFKDYLDFEGGYNKILLNPKAYFSRLNNDFSRFLNNRDFKNSINTFAAANINQALSKKTDLIGYTIYSDSEDELESRNLFEYISDSGNLFEERVSTSNMNNRFLIGKIALENLQENGTTFKLESFIKASNYQDLIVTNSRFNDQNNFINTSSKSDNIDFKQNIEWYKSISENHTLTTLANLNYSRVNSLFNWTTNNDVFQESVPLISDTVLDVSKDKKVSSLSASFLLKDYWTFSDYAHLYTTLGIEYYRDNYETTEFQTLSDQSINDFITSGFGNDATSDFTNSYIGSQLKVKKGKLTVRPGLFFHSYTRNLEQFIEDDRLNKKYLLPQLLIRLDLKKSEKININYNLKVRFPAITNLLINQTLTNFNSIFQGDNLLENELYHEARINYYKFSLLRKYNYNISVNYRKTKQGIRNVAVLDEINFINQPLLLNNSDESVSLFGNIGKGFGDINLQFGGSASFSEFLQVINSNVLTNNSDNYAFFSEFKTRFENFPNLEIKYRRSFDNYQTQITNTKFENDNLDIIVEHVFLKGFVFHLDYNYRKVNNKTTNNLNQNDILNTSLLYQKENSPWTFQISANNLFNNEFIRNNSFSNFLISDNRTFVLPRIILLKIAYKL